MKGWISSPQQNPVDMRSEVKHQVKHHDQNVTVTGGCTSKGDRTARGGESWDPQIGGFPVVERSMESMGVSLWELGRADRIGSDIYIYMYI